VSGTMVTSQGQRDCFRF